MRASYEGLATVNERKAAVCVTVRGELGAPLTVILRDEAGRCVWAYVVGKCSGQKDIRGEAVKISASGRYMLLEPDAFWIYFVWGHAWKRSLNILSWQITSRFNAEPGAEMSLKHCINFSRQTLSSACTYIAIKTGNLPHASRVDEETRAWLKQSPKATQKAPVMFLMFPACREAVGQSGVCLKPSTNRPLSALDLEKAVCALGDHGLTLAGQWLTCT